MFSTRQPRGGNLTSFVDPVSTWLHGLGIYRFHRNVGGGDLVIAAEPRKFNYTRHHKMWSDPDPPPPELFFTDVQIITYLLRWWHSNFVAYARKLGEKRPVLSKHKLKSSDAFWARWRGSTVFTHYFEYLNCAEINSYYDIGIHLLTRCLQIMNFLFDNNC